jgi:hypothetical protein
VLKVLKLCGTYGTKTLKYTSVPPPVFSRILKLKNKMSDIRSVLSVPQDGKDDDEISSDDFLEELSEGDDSYAPNVAEPKDSSQSRKRSYKSIGPSENYQGFRYIAIHHTDPLSPEKYQRSICDVAPSMEKLAVFYLILASLKNTVYEESFTGNKPDFPHELFEQVFAGARDIIPRRSPRLNGSREDNKEVLNPLAVYEPWHGYITPVYIKYFEQLQRSACIRVYDVRQITVDQAMKFLEEVPVLPGPLFRDNSRQYRFHNIDMPILVCGMGTQTFGSRGMVFRWSSGALLFYHHKNQSITGECLAYTVPCTTDIVFREMLKTELETFCSQIHLLSFELHGTASVRCRRVA